MKIACCVDHCRRSEEQAAQNVTASLMELRQMLSSDLKRNEETMHTLINSSNTLGDTKTEMQTISSNVKIGSGLITKLNRRELTDRVLIFLGLVFFFGVVLYILQKRLLRWIW